MASEYNPLLEDSVFPPFHVIEPSHVRPAVLSLLNKLESDLVELEATVEPTWPKLVEPLEKITDRLSIVWGIVNHLHAVKDSPELRSAIEEVQPEKVKFQLRLGQSKRIFSAFKAIRDSSNWESLSDAQKRIVEVELRDAVLNGVSLEDDNRQRFNEIQQELEKLSQKFEENILDAKKRFQKLITDKKDIEGLPATALAMAAQMAISKGHEDASAENGPWVMSLDGPSYHSIMQHAKNRSLREEVYRAYMTCASSGDLNNTPIIDQILKLRLEKANLLGYSNYAEDIKSFAESQNEEEVDELNHWDIKFWSERLHEFKFHINEEELWEFFPLPKVIDGLFSLAKILFSIDICPADGLAPVWNKDVRFYCVKDSCGRPMAYLYFDLYSRPSEKCGGAWVAEVVGRSRVLSRDGISSRLPIAHVVCNQTPPLAGKPSLMNFREVKTLFHEFGHALQHVLTKQDEGLVSGSRGIEWDAVELPSQFMENWCYHRDTLMRIAEHYETGECLPEEVCSKLLSARTFRAGSELLRQLRFSCVDMELHTKYVPGGSESVYDVDQRVGRRTHTIPLLPEDKFLCSLSHIFSDKYAAGYYSYQWAEVLSFDAFSAFEEAGSDNDRAIIEMGQKFRETVLAYGGGKAPLEVFIEFRGREPSTESLLRHNGLLPLTATAKV